MNRREQIERELGVFRPAQPAKVGKRYYAAPAWAPSHWRKTLRGLARWMLIVALVSMAAGYIVGMFA
jgi:hypothetical protein